MNCQTFSENPHTRGKSHHHHYQYHHTNQKPIIILEVSKKRKQPNKLCLHFHLKCQFSLATDHEN